MKLSPKFIFHWEFIVIFHPKCSILPARHVIFHPKVNNDGDLWSLLIIKGQVINNFGKRIVIIVSMIRDFSSKKIKNY